MNKHLLDKANKKYKELYDTGKKRFKNLPYHHRAESNWLEKEEKNQISSYYNEYKRGTIVFVEFGVNIGHELSGGHFAIVLNDNDNKRNSILNVIPLSSKNKKHYYSIDKTVFHNASNHLKQRFDELSNKYQEALKRREEVREDLKELEKEVSEAKGSENIDDEKVNELISKVSIMNDRVVELEEITKENDKNKNLIENVYLRYSKFDKNTYACYQSIQTISKLKIRRINKYDPSGKMKVDNATLDKIDKKIVEYYTNFSIDEK